MTARHRIVTRHALKRTALTELGRLFGLQDRAAENDPEAVAELARLQILPGTHLMVRKEDNRRYRWAVVEPA